MIEQIVSASLHNGPQCLSFICASPLKINPWVKFPGWRCLAIINATDTALRKGASLHSSCCHTVKELVSHLNDHIGEGRSVSCPVSGCKHMFTKKSSFTSHMCRKHKACSPDVSAVLVNKTC